jgi:NADP-dependent 3-hydroxy acid dehydrogenase YdfG
LDQTFAIITGDTQGNGNAIASRYEEDGAIVLSVDTQISNYKMKVVGDISNDLTIGEK